MLWIQYSEEVFYLSVYAFAAAGIIGGSIATLILVLFAYGALMIITLTYEKCKIIFTFFKKYFLLILLFLLLFSHFFFGTKIWKGEGASYQAVVKETFGRNMELVMIISIAVYSFGSCIAYLVIIDDQLVAVVDNFV